ncbi:hypothetical protein [Alkalicoccobacillus gibsonii]|uniref:hypothetical protein n=1 Tax=Alkalicoccobacillus gibsonii TaxID=79881 RepID=UPI001AEED915|nr:hypothetical protein [Alkalicoccobacillus gibsonii]
MVTRSVLGVWPSILGLVFLFLTKKELLGSRSFFLDALEVGLGIEAAFLVGHALGLVEWRLFLDSGLEFLLFWHSSW